MSKITTGLIVILISISFIFFSKTVSQAQDPVPVTNPEPVSPTTSPTTSTNCVPDPPDGSCSFSRPCCNYPNRQRTCDAGYCRDLITPTPISTGPSSAILISELRDLNIGEAKLVTVLGLRSGSKYYWQESKVTSVIPTKGYTTFFTDCYDADSNGKITQNLGPYSIPGFYLLAISRANTNGACRPSGIPLVSSPEFSVGGPTGDSCCDNPITSVFAVYDRKRDACTTKLLPDILPLQPNPQRETICRKKGTFCEPDSLQCFKNKTYVVGGKICKDPKDPGFDPNKNAVCAFLGSKEQQCGTDQDPAIKTAIGCIHTSPAGFIKDFLSFTVAISGGLAFLMMILGAFQMVTSAGNPETLQAGRDRFQSAIIGLLFVIFAVLLLQIIGVGILDIPGFGR